MNGRQRLLIIGNGMAGGRLLDDLLARGASDQYAITVIGEEPHGEYNRIMLSRVVAGADPDEITTKPRAWYSEHGIELISGRWACWPPAGPRGSRRSPVLDRPMAR
jgi:nitrite reductase (NADH) large subunit